LGKVVLKRGIYKGIRSPHPYAPPTEGNFGEIEIQKLKYEILKKGNSYNKIQ
jgi:hypothetical protein